MARRRGTELETRFTGDDSDLQRATKRSIAGANKLGTAYEKSGKKSGKVLDGLSGKLKGVAATMAAGFTVNAGVNFVKGRTDENEKYSDTIDKMLKRSEQLGIHFETFQRQVAMFGNAKISADEYYNSLSKLTRKAKEAATSNDTLRKSFEELGIDVDIFSQLSPDEQFRQLATAYRESPDKDRAFLEVAKIIEDDAKKMRDRLAHGGGVMRAEEAMVKPGELIDIRDAQSHAALQDMLAADEREEVAKRAKESHSLYVKRKVKSTLDEWKHRAMNLLSRPGFTTNDEIRPDLPGPANRKQPSSLFRDRVDPSFVPSVVRPKSDYGESRIDAALKAMAESQAKSEKHLEVIAGEVQ